MNRNVRKRTSGHVRLAKIQIIRAVWSESSLGAFRIAKDAKVLYVDYELSDQTAWMRGMIWVFVGRTCQKVHFLMLWLVQSNLNGSNTDGSFTMANLNSFLNPNDILPIVKKTNI